MKNCSSINFTGDNDSQRNWLKSIICGGANVMMNMIYCITSNNTKEPNIQINK